MASSKEIEGGMASNHPEPVILPPEVSHQKSQEFPGTRFCEVKPECVKTGALGHVPNPDALVLAVAQDQLLPAHTGQGQDQALARQGLSPWVEDGAADIVVVAPASVNLPSLGEEGRSLAIRGFFVHTSDFNPSPVY